MELVLVSGNSGTGKSALVERTLRRGKEANHLFVTAKFDQLEIQEPFTAVVRALSDICDLILQEQQASRVRQDLVDALTREDIGILVQTIPSLSFLTNLSPNSTSSSPRDRGLDQADVRRQILYRSFLQICARDERIVLFLDDCQWADADSLCMLQKLFVHPQSRNILLVCAYRDEDSSVLVAQDEFWQINSAQGRVAVRIQLGALTPSSTSDLVSEVLRPRHGHGTDEYNRDVSELSGIVHRKTQGNAYFTIQYLDSLVASELLRFDDPDDRWTWATDRIQAETNVSENVADVVTRKIQSLPSEIQRILQVAACLGHTFDSSMLEIVVSTTTTMDTSFVRRTPSVSDMLHDAAVQGLVEGCKGGRTYKFSHDRVQQCLYDLIGENKSVMHLSIGTSLRKAFSSNPVQYGVCVLIADQLNLGARNVEDEASLWELAEYNAMASRRARAKLSFGKSAEYLRVAISLIQRANEANLWREAYRECLDIYNTLADVECSLGNFESSREATDVVLAKAVSFEDKKRAYATQALIISSRGLFKEATFFGIHVLRLSGVNFPERPGKLQVAWAVGRSLQRMKNVSADDILALPAMVDEEKLSEAEQLQLIAQNAGLGQEAEISMYACLWILRSTLTHGISLPGCQALSAFAMILAMKGERQRAFQLGMAVLKLIVRPQFSRQGSHAAFYVLGYVYHLRRPLAEAFRHLDHSHRHGLQDGNVEFALMAGLNAGLVLYFSGEPLPLVDEYLRDIFQTNKEYRTFSMASVIEPFWQAVLNLMGRSEASPLELTGEAMCERDELRQAVATNNDLVVFMIRFHLSIVCGFLEAYDRAEEVYEAMQRKPAATLQSHYLNPPFAFFLALLWSARYLKTGHKKYRKRLNRTIRSFRSLASEGSILHKPFLHILLAEQQAIAAKRSPRRLFRRGPPVEQQTKLSCDAYNLAIDTAIICEVPHYEAVANEKAGNALASYDKHIAIGYYERAVELYGKWGAVVPLGRVEAKLERLQASVSTPAAKGSVAPPRVISTTLSSGDFSKGALETGL